MEPRRIRPKHKRPSTQDVSVQWVEDKIRAEIDNAVSILKKAWVEPFEEKIRLQEAKLAVLGMFFTDMGSTSGLGGKSVRTLMEEMTNIEEILCATDYDALLQSAGACGITSNGDGEFVSLTTIITDLNPHQPRTQDDIIEDVLEQMYDDDLDV